MGREKEGRYERTIVAWVRDPRAHVGIHSPRLEKDLVAWAIGLVFEAISREGTLVSAPA